MLQSYLFRRILDPKKPAQVIHSSQGSKGALGQTICFRKKESTRLCKVLMKAILEPSEPDEPLGIGDTVESTNISGIPSNGGMFSYNISCMDTVYGYRKTRPQEYSLKGFSISTGKFWYLKLVVKWGSVVQQEAFVIECFP